jgi:REP element-mobilizing transposase RayT
MLPKPHGRDLRRGRCSEPNRIYLVTTTTHERQPLFTEMRLGRIVVETIKGEQPRASTLAYVVMPDHLHWLLQLSDTAPLDTVVRNVKSISAHRINLAFNSTGKRWQAGYHDHAVRSEEDIRDIARYIVANPLRAGLVKRIGDYPLWDAIWL